MSTEYEGAAPATTYEPAPVAPAPYPQAVFDQDQASLESSTADVAKEQAAAVGGTAADAGQHVASVAKDQASNVAAEAVQQGKDLLGQTRTELQEQAAAQQQRVATGIRSLSEELGSMADRSEQDGVATDLVRQAAQRAGQVAGWLDQRDPGGLLADVKDFARRRPGAFLAIAAGAGLAAGRLTRGTIAANKDSGDAGSTTSTTVPDAPYARPATAPAPVTSTSPAFAAPVTETGYEPVGTVLPGQAPVAAPVSDYPATEPWEGRP